MLGYSESTHTPTVLRGIASVRDAFLPSRHRLSLYAKLKGHCLEDDSCDKSKNKRTTSSSESYKAA